MVLSGCKIISRDCRVLAVSGIAMDLVFFRMLELRLKDGFYQLVDQPVGHPQEAPNLQCSYAFL